MIRVKNISYGWEKTTLENICDLKAGNFIPASEILDISNKSYYPCFGGNGLRGFVKNYSHNGVFSLIGRQGALCGNIKKVSGKFYATEHAIVVTPNSNINVDWLYYQLIYLDLNKYATGVAQPGLSVKNIKEISLILPPLLEQKAIADLLSTWDKAIVKTERLIRVKERRFRWLLRKLMSPATVSSNSNDECLVMNDEMENNSELSTHHSALENTLSKPRNTQNDVKWKKVKLGDICNLYQPQTISKKDMSKTGIYKVFGANGVIGFYEKYNHEESEIVITCRGATCGTINRTEPKSWITGNAMVAQPNKNKILKDYLFYSLLVSNMKSVISGAAQPQITRQDLSPLNLWLPPLEFQHQITNTLSSSQQEIDLLKKLAEKYKIQKRGLMQKMLTGEWRIKSGIVNQYKEV